MVIDIVGFHFCINQYPLFISHMFFHMPHFIVNIALHFLCVHLCLHVAVGDCEFIASVFPASVYIGHHELLMQQGFSIIKSHIWRPSRNPWLSPAWNGSLSTERLGLTELPRGGATRVSHCQHLEIEYGQTRAPISASSSLLACVYQRYCILVEYRACDITCVFHRQML